MKLKKISDTGFTQMNRNGGWCQTVVLENEKDEKYKIEIESESCESQSWSDLFKWTEIGWKLIVRKNTKVHFGIDLSYKSSIPSNSFDNIIKEYKELIEHF